MASAMSSSPRCAARALKVFERDPGVDACLALLGEETEDSSVFGEEQRAVGKDADLALGRT
jgi:hypothetical protein